MRVVADLSGDRLEAAVEGGLDLLKVSDEELVEHGRSASRSTDDVVRAARTLRDEGADRVVVSRRTSPRSPSTVSGSSRSPRRR